MNETCIIEARGVVKDFHDGERELHILRGVDLKILEGERLAISGPSGAGKSTLLHILGTLDAPTEGDVFFRGQSLRTMAKSHVNRIRNEEIGFVFQFYHLLPEFSALENVMMPALSRGARKRECAPRAEELLTKVGLDDRMTHKPGMLSGGEQQRVAIARALFNEPRVVLADEPTGNLDEHTGEGITELLWDLSRSEGVTVVVVTHDDAIAADGDRWIHLHEGKTELRKG